MIQKIFSPPMAYRPDAMSILCPLTQCPTRARMVDAAKIPALRIAKIVEILKRKQRMSLGIDLISDKK